MYRCFGGRHTRFASLKFYLGEFVLYTWHLSFCMENRRKGSAGNFLFFTFALGCSAGVNGADAKYKYFWLLLGYSNRLRLFEHKELESA